MKNDQDHPILRQTAREMSDEQLNSTIESLEESLEDDPTSYVSNYERSSLNVFHNERGVRILNFD